VANDATAEIIFAKDKGKERDPETINIDEFIAVKGIKAIGNQFTKFKVKAINITIPEPVEEEPEVYEEPEPTGDLMKKEESLEICSRTENLKTKNNNYEYTCCHHYCHYLYI
jgi:hypothetical protein